MAASIGRSYPSQSSAAMAAKQRRRNGGVSRQRATAKHGISSGIMLQSGVDHMVTVTVAKSAGAATYRKRQPWHSEKKISVKQQQQRGISSNDDRHYSYVMISRSARHRKPRKSSGIGINGGARRHGVTWHGINRRINVRRACALSFAS